MRHLITLLAAFAPIPAAATPPVSVAVAFDRSHIRPVLAEGEADRATHRLVTADDPVRIASISKLVTALGVMRLVDAGKLDLDRDVSDYLGWKLRNPAFPEAKITLRLLLSHQSSLLDGGELYLIPLGITLRNRLSDPRVWDPAHAPDSGWFHYTNLNFPVIGSVIERVTGERFDVAMSRIVLKPLKLDACFNWGAGCSAEAYRHAVVLYRANGEVARDDLHGSPPVCPVFVSEDHDCDLSGYRPGDNGALFSPQGGLRISMRDLARIGQMLARNGKGFLSANAMYDLVRPRWHFDGTNGVGEDGAADGFFCRYGLAIQWIGDFPPPLSFDPNGEPRPVMARQQCNDDLFGDGKRRLGHSGDAYGLKSGLWFDPKTGRGLAFFTTAVADDAPGGRSAFTAIEESIVERSAKPPFR